MSAGSLTDRNAALAEKLAEKLGIGGKDLAAKIRKAGRRLPKRLRREGRFLAEAAKLEAHPKLSRQIDPIRVDTAYRDFDAHLDPISKGDRWWGFFLNLTATLSFNLLLFAALLIALLAWRGDIGLG